MSEHRAPTGTAKVVSSLSEIQNVGIDNIYNFITHSYEGSGGYANGEYLVKFDKETSLSRRQKLVYYKPYVKSIIDSLLIPVFSEEALRTTNNTMFEQFLDNVDLKGNTMQEFSETVLKYTRLHGVCFTVMDNFSDLPALESEAIRYRKYPYIYHMTADQVDDFDVDDYGRLEEISFIDDKIEDSDDRKVQSYRKWTDTYSVIYIKKDGEEVEIGDRVEHNLGFLPVIGTYLNMDSAVLPFPPTYDLCRLAYTIYNQDSEQRNLERLTAFPMLTVQSKSNDINMNIGADSLLVYGGDYDGSVTVPSWINPSSDILTVMSERSQQNVDNLISVSDVLGATAISKGSQTASGVSMSYSFLGQNASLKQTAKIAENFELLLSIMFGQMINQTVEYTVVYRDNYKPSDSEIEKKLSILERLIEMDMSDMITNEIKKELIKDISTFYNFDVDGEVLAQSISTQNII